MVRHGQCHSLRYSGPHKVSSGTYAEVVKEQPNVFELMQIPMLSARFAVVLEVHVFRVFWAEKLFVSA